MDPHTVQLPQGSHTTCLSTSPRSTGEESNVSPSTATASHLPKRSSSVRFADDEVEESPSMSPRRHSADTDEVTPIRQADGRGSRNYSTTDREPRSESTESVKPAAPAAASRQAEDKQPWYKRIAEKYGSVSLDNKGSVARDHLALERTFLAWLRTSLAFASIGIAVTQLFRLNTSIQNRTKSTAYPASQTSLLPLSPLLGHGLPPELVPFLQQLAHSATWSLPAAMPTNTILDQLLLMPPFDTRFDSIIHEQEFNSHAAAKLRRVGKPLGATFIGISIIVLLVGFHRYFEAQYWIIRGKFPASRGSVAFVGFIAGALIVASLIVVLVVAPVSYEKR